MTGLTGYGWSTPENWTMADGHRLVSQWDQVLGEREDGTPWLVAGLSILYYVGDGLFCYSHDMLNMTHIGGDDEGDGVEAARQVQHAAAAAEPRHLATARVGPPGEEPCELSRAAAARRRPGAGATAVL